MGPAALLHRRQPPDSDSTKDCTATQASWLVSSLPEQRRARLTPSMPAAKARRRHMGTSRDVTHILERLAAAATSSETLPHTLADWQALAWLADVALPRTAFVFHRSCPSLHNLE